MNYAPDNAWHYLDRRSALGHGDAQKPYGIDRIIPTDADIDQAMRNVTTLPLVGSKGYTGAVELQIVNAVKRLANDVRIHESIREKGWDALSDFAKLYTVGDKKLAVATYIAQKYSQILEDKALIAGLRRLEQSSAGPLFAALRAGVERK